MIASDWRVAMNALQILAERGPGQRIAAMERDEDAALRQSLKALGG